MRRPRAATFARIAVLSAAAAAVASDAPAGLREIQLPAAVPVDVQRLGPQVGERVPDFTLRDQSGATRTLASVLGPEGALLVLFRSADW